MSEVQLFLPLVSVHQRNCGLQAFMTARDNLDLSGNHRNPQGGGSSVNPTQPPGSAPRVLAQMIETNPNSSDLVGPAPKSPPLRPFKL